MGRRYGLICSRALSTSASDGVCIFLCICERREAISSPDQNEISGGRRYTAPIQSVGEALQWQYGGGSPMKPQPGLSMLQRYLPPSVVMDEDAPESWVFLDYRIDGRVLVLPREQYEAIYRPAPEDQG